MPDFAARVDALIAEHFALHPLHATGAGIHDHDGRWPDMTEAGRAERVAFCDRWSAELATLATGDLAPDERIDAEFLISELAAHRFAETDLREECWSPLEWVYLLGEGIFGLISREFAPLADRLTSVASRLEGMPALLDAGRDVLVGVDGRPVDRFHTEKALDSFSGIGELVDDALAQADAAADSDPAVATVVPRLRIAAAAAHAALDAFGKHLRETVLPASVGEGRIGSELFGRKLLHTFRTDTATIDSIRDRAEREFAAVRAEMIRIAREIWPTWCPNEPLPSEESAIVRGVLDAIAVEHPAADEILDFCREELARIETFCREHDIIGLADEPLEIRWTPVFMRTFAGAMLSSPGPFDAGQKAFFSVTPVDEEWPPERAESYLRESNSRMLQLLVIHEAVPGHYLQGVYANRSRSVARSVFGSGVFAEGWAVYVTQVMIDAGFGADDPALLLNHWKFYLRSTTNALIDIGIHTAGMTEEEAIGLMVDGGFQEEGEARSKYDRARLSSTQLCTYFVGSVEMWDLERERRRRMAAASGDPRGADAVPEPRVVGGFGNTPGFVHREHLEDMISHGEPPIPFLRRIVLG
ncbi:MAG: hypothetical protein QOH14_4061 [Pseudonocardiales bacterium]|jgi:uncharacterized protein (DUF885 family)|nr:hypothetical protein [Pseudonocardiales bacterium]